MQVTLGHIQEVTAHAKKCAACHRMAVEWMRSWRIGGADLQTFAREIMVVLQVVRSCPTGALPIIQEES